MKVKLSNSPWLNFSPSEETFRAPAACVCVDSWMHYIRETAQLTPVAESHEGHRHDSTHSDHTKNPHSHTHILHCSSLIIPQQKQKWTGKQPTTLLQIHKIHTLYSWRCISSQHEFTKYTCTDTFYASLLNRHHRCWNLYSHGFVYDALFDIFAFVFNLNQWVHYDCLKNMFVFSVIKKNVNKSGN